MNQEARQINWRYVGIFVPATAPEPTKTFEEATEEFFGVPIVEILAKRRNPDVVGIRHMMRAWLHNKMGLKQIAKRTGCRDHATVIHSLHKHNDFMDVDKSWRRQYEAYCKHMEGVVA